MFSKSKGSTRVLCFRVLKENVVDHVYQSIAANNKLVKRAVNVNKLDTSLQQHFLEREWLAWKDFAAVKVLSKEVSP